MITSHKLQTLNFCKDIEDLICQIDSTLAYQAKSKLDSLRYGTKVCVDTQDFEYLSTYRNILIKKSNNDPCFGEYPLDSIISRIKQLLNKN